MLNDLRLAVRQWRKSPGATAVAVLSLAVGIGTGTAVFSLVNALLLRPLPVPDPGALRLVTWGARASRIPSWDGAPSVSPPAFAALRKAGAPHAEIFGFSPLDDVIVRFPDAAAAARGTIVTDNFFQGLGVRAFIGRTFEREVDYAGGAMSVVLSHACWQTRLAGDSGAIGRTIALNGHAFTVVGVLPPGFDGVQPGRTSELYVPLSSASPFLYRPLGDDFHWYVRMMARLRPGADERQLREVLGVTLASAAGTTMTEPRIQLAPGGHGTTYDAAHHRRPLVLLLGAVGVVLLVACANVAGLQLAGGLARRHEWAVRGALGAGRVRLARQALAEGLAVALAGGALGVWLAVVLRTGIARLLADGSGELCREASLDGAVLVFGLALALGSALASSSLPAWSVARLDAQAELRGRAEVSAAGSSCGALLVSAQVGLSVVLLVAGGLLVRTLVNLSRTDAGFPADRLLLLQVNTRGSEAASGDPTAFHARTQAALAAIPGVRSASLVEFPLLSGANSSGAFSSFSRRPPRPGVVIDVRRLTVGESFFETMGIPLLAGRGLSAADDISAPKVVVVNEAFVRKHLPREDPLGLTIPMWNADWRIVGVYRDVKYGALREAAPPTAYFPFRQRLYARFRATHLRNPYFAVRTALPPLALSTAVREAVRKIDPAVPITSLTTQDEVRSRAMSRERLLALLCGALGLVAVVLSCIGIYGLLAQQVARRRPEIAVRMAVGARPIDALGAVVRRAVLLAGLGLAVGVPAAWAATRLIASQLYGVERHDPIVLGGAVLTLLTVALVSAYVPARRAAAVDPMVALRCE